MISYGLLLFRLGVIHKGYPGKGDVIQIGTQLFISLIIEIISSDDYTRKVNFSTKTFSK